MLNALMDSAHEGGRRIETPHLQIAYESYAAPLWRPTAPRPTGANTAVWPP